MKDYEYAERRSAVKKEWWNNPVRLSQRIRALNLEAETDFVNGYQSLIDTFYRLFPPTTVKFVLQLRRTLERKEWFKTIHSGLTLDQHYTLGAQIRALLECPASTARIKSFKSRLTCYQRNLHILMSQEYPHITMSIYL